MDSLYLFLVSLLLTFAITVLVSRRLIPVLKSHKMGQRILEIGPRWHKNKEGTPTMGGLAFMIASVLVGLCGLFFLWTRRGMSGMLPAAVTLVYAVLNGLIGVIDDSAKLRHKANEGLTASQKYLLQLLAAALYLCLLRLLCGLDTTLRIPFFGVSLNLGWFYYVVALLLLTGIVNSVNLTDGIDGLCSSVTMVVGLFFALAAFWSEIVDAGLLLVAALIVGSSGGFLVYNFHPARVFMGDTGSLFLGGLLVGGAFMMGNPLLIVVAGIIYIMESASVILQVAYFKLTHGKRLFRMSPIHHHFEKCGWSEVKIVVVFSLVTVAFCAVALFGV